ncbi:MAG: rRNA maturation RNase YbeY [Opitutales bacterium]
MKQISLEISNRYSALESPERATIALFESLIHSNKFPIGSGELSIAFVDDPTIAQIHADFMNDPTPTDVITFPADPEMESAGEIIVSVDHARSRSIELGETFSRELRLYLIHGWLHLAGFDDLSDEDRAQMRLAEKEALALVEASGNCIQYHMTEKK